MAYTEDSLYAAPTKEEEDAVFAAPTPEEEAAAFADFDESKVQKKGVGGKLLDVAKDIGSDIWGGIEYVSEGIRDAATGASQTLSLGLMDELAGAGDTLIDTLKGQVDLSKLPEEYRKRQEAAEQFYKQSSERSPILYTGAEIGASMVPALGTAGLVSKLSNVGKGVGLVNKALRVGKAGATGAALGGVYGFGASEEGGLTTPEERQTLLDDILMGSLGGGVIGGGMQGVGEVAGPLLKKGMEAAGKKAQKWRESSHVMDTIMTGIEEAKKGVDWGTAKGRKIADRYGVAEAEDLITKFENTKNLLGKNLEQKAIQSNLKLKLGPDMKPILKELRETIETDPKLLSNIFGGDFKSEIFEDLIGTSKSKLDKFLDKIINEERTPKQLHDFKVHLNSIRKHFSEGDAKKTLGRGFAEDIVKARDLINKKLDSVQGYTEANNLYKQFRDKTENILAMKAPMGKYDMKEAISRTSDAYKRKQNLVEAMFGTAGTGETNLAGKRAEGYMIDALKKDQTLNKVHEAIKGLEALYTSAGKQLPEEFSNIIHKRAKDIHKAFKDPSRQLTAANVIRGVNPHVGERQTVKEMFLGVQPHRGLSTLSKVANQYVGGSLPVINQRNVNKVKDFITMGGTDSILKFADFVDNTPIKGLSTILRKGAENPDQAWKAKAQLIIQTNPVYKEALDRFLERGEYSPEAEVFDEPTM